MSNILLRFVLSGAIMVIGYVFALYYIDYKESGKEEFEEKTVHRTDSILQFNVMVTEIFEDSKHNYWFGTHGDGICKYDGEIYTYFRAGEGLPFGTDREFTPGTDWSDVRNLNGGNQTHSIQEDQAGNIWMKSSDYISKFDGKEFKKVTPTIEMMLPTDLSQEEWEDDLENLWFSSVRDLALYSYDGKDLEKYMLPITDLSQQDGVSALYIDSKGNMWLGTMDNGTYKYDGKSFTKVTSRKTKGISRSVFEDKSGRLWVPQNGLDMFYMENEKLVSFSEEYLKKFPNTPEEDLLVGAQCIEQDETGTIWFGSFGDGIYSFDGTSTTHISSVENLEIDIAKIIYKDSSGKLWFGINEGTVYGYENGSFERFDELKK